MRLRSLLLGSLAPAGIVGAALAAPFRIVEVASVANLPVSQIAPQTIAFSDHKEDNVTDRASGLIKFDDWAQTRMVQKQFLGLYPGYDQPVLGLGTAAKPHKKRLHVYVAEGRFALKRAPASFNLGEYATLAFIQRLDPAIKHKVIAPADVVASQAKRYSGVFRAVASTISRVPASQDRIESVICSTVWRAIGRPQL